MNERKVFLKPAKNEDDTTTCLFSPITMSTANTKRPTASGRARREEWLVKFCKENNPPAAMRKTSTASGSVDYRRCWSLGGRPLSGR